MPRRSAHTSWVGGLQDGSGHVTLSSSGVGAYDVSFPRRAADDAEGTTSPEELIAAALASCDAMQLSGRKSHLGADPLHGRRSTSSPRPTRPWCIDRRDAHGRFGAPRYHGLMPSPSNTVAAILLSGGASRRMGKDKTQLVIDGSTLAVRTGELLARVAATAIEVGPGVSGLPSFLETPRGEGPLVAIAAGCHALDELGHAGAALIVACDLPFLSEELLRFIVNWDMNGTVVPVVGGRPQPLCAKWSSRDLHSAQELVDRGIRSLQHVSQAPDAQYLHESNWGRVVTERQFCDVDDPEDLQRLGLTSALQF